MEGTDVCFAPVLSHGRGAAAPAQRRTASTFVERRRRRAAGAGAALQPARRARSSARRPTPASTPTRSSPSWGFDADRDRQAPRRRRRRLTPMATTRLLPRPSRRRVDRRPAARWPRRPRRATASCWSFATRGEHGEVGRRRSSTTGEPLGERRDRRDASGRPRSSASQRVEFLGYVDSGMIGDAENDAAGLVLAGRRRRGRRAAGRDPRARSRPTSSPSTTTTAATATPTTSRSTGSGVRAGRAGRAPRTCFEATMNRDSSSSSIRARLRVGRRSTSATPRRPTIDEENFGQPESVITHRIDVSRSDRGEAGLDARPTPARSPTTTSSWPCPTRRSAFSFGLGVVHRRPRRRKRRRAVRE